MTDRRSYTTIVYRLTHGDLQGCLALGLLAILFVIPYLHLGSSTWETRLGLLMMCLVVAFGIRGLSSARRVGRWSARIALFALFVVVAASVASVAVDFLNGLRDHHL